MLFFRGLASFFISDLFIAYFGCQNFTTKQGGHWKMMPKCKTLKTGQNWFITPNHLSLIQVHSKVSKEWWCRSILNFCLTFFIRLFSHLFLASFSLFFNTNVYSWCVFEGFASFRIGLSTRGRCRSWSSAWLLCDETSPVDARSEAHSTNLQTCKLKWVFLFHIINWQLDKGMTRFQP